MRVEAGLSRNALRAYGTDLRALSRRLASEGLTHWRELTEDAVYDWLADRRNDQAAEASVAGGLVSLRMLVRFLVQEEIFAPTPRRGCRPPASAAAPHTLTPEQVDTLLRPSCPRARPLRPGGKHATPPCWRCSTPRARGSPRRSGSRRRTSHRITPRPPAWQRRQDARCPARKKGACRPPELDRRPPAPATALQPERRSTRGSDLPLAHGPAPRPPERVAPRQGGRAARESPPAISPPTCAILSPPTCWPAEPTCAQCRRCSATHRSGRRRSTPTSTRSTCAPCTGCITPVGDA